MKIPAYAADGKTLLGHIVDGDFVPLQTPAQTIPPAPEGEALESLIDDCCHWIEQSVGTFKKRLAPELQPDNDGRSSLTLSEGKNRWGGSAGHGGVRSWIVEGNVRKPEQIREPINKFLSMMEQRVRVKRHIDPNWKIDNDAMTILGSRFGLDAPRTFEELRAWQAERQIAAEQQQAERTAKFKRRQKEWRESPEGLAFAEKMRVDEFKREQVRIVMDALFPFEHIEYADPENPTEEEKVANKPKRLHNQDAADNRREWEPVIRIVVNKTNLAAHAVVRVWETANEEYLNFEEPDFTSREYIMETLMQVANESLRENPAPLTKSCVPPAIDGVVQLHRAKFADLKDEMEKLDNEGYVLDIRRDFAGLVLTAVPARRLTR
jgi:hypothetical protein